MRQLADRLLIADQSACGTPEGDISLACCCRACWQRVALEQTGMTALPRQHPGYLHFSEPHRLSLKLTNSEEAIYPAKLFETFLDWAEQEWTAGRTLLLHSIEGIGRAPTLGMLFAAKKLGCLPDNYDSAWDEVGEWYHPCAGLEEWMRAHWADFPCRKIAYIEGASKPTTTPECQELPAEEKAVLAEAKSSTLTVAQAVEMARMSAMIHFAGFARIKGKEGTLTPEKDHNTPSKMQAEVFMAYDWLLTNNLPIRIIIGPKARQSYGSTAAAELMYHHSRRFHCDGMMIADENDRTDQIWEMFNGLAKNDRFAGYWDSRHENNQEKATFIFVENDKARTFVWGRDTASDAMAGSAGTRQCLWFSEAGRYGKGGTVTDAQVIQNASGSVPNSPGTMILMESVSGGPTGYFHDTCKGAVTLRERISGKPGNGWIKIFCGWHEVPDYKLARRPEYEHLFTTSLDERERRGVMLYGWTAEQIAWRRNQISSVYMGNEAAFDRELPESEDVAFHAGGTPKFCQKGTARLQAMAKTGHDFAKLGTIEENAGKVTMLLDTQNPWLWMREEPMVGGRYIVFGDFMTAEQSEGSKKRDGHAAGVWRAPFRDTDGNVRNGKLVAAIYSKHPEITWQTHIIARRVHLMSKLYGGAIIGLEVNEALGILRDLQMAGANLWRRVKNDELAPGQTLNIPGWRTTSATRDILVNEMAKAIHEQTVDIDYAPLVRQISIFQERPDGTCAAPSGEHDDWVLGGGIGLALISNATEFQRPLPRRPTSMFEEPEHSRFGSHGLA